MSRFLDRASSPMLPAGWETLVIIATTMTGRSVPFGGYVDQDEREILRGVGFGVVLSNTFGVVR